MTRTETSEPVFRGHNDRGVRWGDLVRLFADTFDTLLYKTPTQDSEVEISSAQEPVTAHSFRRLSRLYGYTQKFLKPLKAPTYDRIYTDNESFWQDALRGTHFQSMRIHLQGFHLTEWIPSAPGRYFTPQAAHSRSMAENYISDIRRGRRKTYLPLGKSEMILGGVGSLRLAAKTIDSHTIYFLGASSTGVSHQGIPVAMPVSEYRQVISIIKDRGGCLTNIVGTLRVLPTHLSLIQYDRDIPKYYLLAEEIQVIKPSSEDDILITVAILLSKDQILEVFNIFIIVNFALF